MKKYIITIEVHGMRRKDLCTEKTLNETVKDYEQAGWKVKKIEECGRIGDEE